MGVFEDTNAFWELASATSSVIPEDARNISQPKELRFLSSIPLDINSNSDSDQKIKQVQEWLKTSPFGISYSGSVDGIFNSSMVSSLISISNKIKMLYPEEGYLTLTTGDKVLFSNVNKALEIQKKHLISKKEDKISSKEKEKLSDEEKDKSSKELDVSLDVPKSNEINAYRAIFGLSLNNQLDHELIIQLKNLEQKIAKKLNDSSVSGMIYDPIAKKIKTSAEDIKESIKLIGKI